MKSRRATPLSIVTSALPLALAIVFSAPTEALAVGDWIGVEASLWRQSQDGNASIDGSLFGGTTFDFQDTVGLAENDNTMTGRVWFRFSKAKLVFDYFDSSRSGDTILTQSFVFNDTLYTAGQNVQSDLNVKLYQGQFLFSIADLKVVDVGAGFGLNQAKIKMDLDGSVSGQTSFDESVPYPTVAAYVTIKPVPGFHIKAELNAMRANVSGTEVDLLDARAQVEIYVAHVLGFFAGYRQFRFDVVDEDFGSVQNTFKGPYAGIGLKF
jgi:hypothetical protein